MILSIDPGTTKSAYVLLDDSEQLVDVGILPNESMVEQLQIVAPAELVIEMIESYGMAVGSEIFVTCRWTGRFQQAFHAPNRVEFLGRKAVKLNLCGSARAKDANIRQAIIDRYGGSAAIRKGGPLYKVSSHIWAALAVGLTYLDQQKVGGKL